MQDFEKLGIDPPVLQIMKKQGLIEPTEIQTKAIPPGLEGKDIVGMSATGSGKTLVFATVLIHNIDKEPGVQAVILTPTRELTEQVARTIRPYARSKKMEVVEIIGGMPMGPQVHKLKSADIVVGTPGRVLDHIGKRSLKLNAVKLFILDEADRMFDMGFIKDVKEIMNYCPYEKQMMLFSATINREVLELADKHMKNPVTISVQNFVDPAKLKQVYYEIDGQIKLSLLIHLLKTEKKGLAMVFCNSRKTVDFVKKNLVGNGIEAHALHGGMVQNKRSKVIKDFHTNSVHVLVCTDVAARGLDIKGVQHVYNYNLPRDPTDYIHRIGRTARAGEEGKAISLLAQDEHQNFRRVLNTSKGKIREMITPQVGKISVQRLEERSRPVRRGGKSPNNRWTKSTDRGSSRPRSSNRGRATDSGRPSEQKRSWGSKPGRSNREEKPTGPRKVHGSDKQAPRESRKGRWKKKDDQKQRKPGDRKRGPKPNRGSKPIKSKRSPEAKSQSKKSYTQRKSKSK